MPDDPIDPASLTEDQWRERLTPAQYHICREKGTEPAFSGELTDFEGDGAYACVACGEVLFDSMTKFHSGCGWPSFNKAGDNDPIGYHEDSSHGMSRTEVTCKRCGSHLGHVFDDGPPPTGKRYCINSISITFNGRDT